jgi:hypothetical protein
VAGNLFCLIPLLSLAALKAWKVAEGNQRVQGTVTAGCFTSQQYTSLSVNIH